MINELVCLETLPLYFTFVVVFHEINKTVNIVADLSLYHNFSPINTLMLRLILFES